MDLISKLFNPADIAIGLIHAEDDEANDQEYYEIVLRRKVLNPMLDYMMNR